MHTILLGKKTKFILSLSVVSMIGIQAAQAEFEIHCPGKLTEHSKHSVTGGRIYTYSGETTGKTLAVASVLNNQEARVNAKAPKLLDLNGAATSFTCVYEGIQQGQSVKVDIGGKFNDIDNCTRVKPDGGKITTENTYYKCP